ncbi:MAG: family 20 glycosylhydrolase [Bacteroidales bacterium]
MRRIAELFTLLSLLTVLSGCAERDGDKAREPISVIPQPAHIQEDEGVFKISEKTCVVVDTHEEGMEKIAGFLNDRLEKSAGFRLDVTSDMDQESGIFFMNAGLPHEAYGLHIEPNRIVVDYGDPAGAFYALQTILQLLPEEIYSDTRHRGIKLSVPCCQIEDEPRFKYRGMHLDCCLHFFDVDFLKRYIDLMALHKINTFHWHLTEDQGWRLEIKKYPLLTEKGQWREETVIGSLRSKIYDGKKYGGYYTQDQVRDLVKYAADRYVTIIPEIEMPGHALAALSCYPELGCGLDSVYKTATKWGVFKQVYCPKEETFAFLEDVMDEVFELFPSKLIHIGGDECPKVSWKQCAHCQALIKKLNLKDEFGLQSYFVQRMEKYINSKGREIIGWDEILQGGLAPNAKVMSWLGEEGGINAARQHHEVVMAPYQKYYLDYWQADPDSEPLAMGGPTALREMYDYNPVPDVLTSEEERYIIGIEGCVWTEYLPTPQRVEYMAYPRMCAIAETAWSKAPKDWNGFAHRLENHLKRLDALGVSYCDAFFNPLIEFHPDTKYSKVVTMSVDVPEADIYYTLDGTEPDKGSLLYDCPFVINRSQLVKAVAIRDGRKVGAVKTKRFLD